MGKTDDVVADYGKEKAEPADVQEEVGSDTEKKINIELISVENGLKKIAEGGWYLDRYRTALKDGCKHPESGWIVITDDKYEASRRFDSDSRKWIYQEGE